MSINNNLDDTQIEKIKSGDRFDKPYKKSVSDPRK